MGEFTSLGTLGPGPFAGVKRSGDLKGIATLTNSDEPAIAFPDVPTTRMQGYSTEFSLSWWWFVRADTPDDVVAKLEAAFAKVMNDPAVQEEIVARGITEPAYDDAATARQQITDQLAGIQEILEELRDDVQQ
jgi:tripartite-type tricarboxylate transporter receptor subunit TctC